MKKNLIAIFSGFFISLMLFAFAEQFFRLNKEYHWVQPRSIQQDRTQIDWDTARSEEIFNKIKNLPVMSWMPLNPMAEGESLKLEPRVVEDENLTAPCCVFKGPRRKNISYSVTEKSAVSGKVITQTRYTLDSRSRRVTAAVRDPQKYILMFGDSYTLGTGVDDEQSAPMQLGKMRPTTQVYNYGLSGGSPNEFLDELQNDRAERLESYADHKPVTVLYTFMDHHLERLICRSVCVGTWMESRPYFSLNDGKVFFNGFFYKDRTVRNAIYRFLNGSALFSFFNVVWPLRIEQGDIDLFAAVMAEAKKEIGLRYPGAEFKVVLFPGASQIFGTSIRDACEKRGIEVLDYSRIDMNVATQGKAEIPGDGHPSPIAQYVFSLLLNQDLH